MTKREKVTTAVSVAFTVIAAVAIFQIASDGLSSWREAGEELELLRSDETKAAPISVDEKVNVIGEDVRKIREQQLEEYRAKEEECKRRVGELEQQLQVLRELEYPALDCKTTGLTYLQQVRLNVVFKRYQLTAQEVLAGAGPNPAAVEVIKAILTEADFAHLLQLLPAEFERHGRSHMKWRTADPLAQKLYWYLCYTP